MCQGSLFSWVQGGRAARVVWFFSWGFLLCIDKPPTGEGRLSSQMLLAQAADVFIVPAVSRDVACKCLWRGTRSSSPVACASTI